MAQDTFSPQLSKSSSNISASINSNNPQQDLAKQQSTKIRDLCDSILKFDRIMGLNSQFSLDEQKTGFETLLYCLGMGDIQANNIEEFQNKCQEFTYTIAVKSGRYKKKTTLEQVITFNVSSQNLKTNININIKPELTDYSSIDAVLRHQSKKGAAKWSTLFTGLIQEETAQYAILGTIRDLILGVDKSLGKSNTSGLDLIFIDLAKVKKLATSKP
jgi:hypothetical protein